MTDRISIPDTGLCRREEGQTMAEYGVVLGVIVLGVIVAIGLLTVAVEGNFVDIGSTIRDLVPS